MACNQQNKHTLRFFKIITTKSLQDGKLRIPNSFTRKYGGGDMSNSLLLKTPDGKDWKIYLTKNDGDIWFQKGWKEFATYYSLDHGHMVLFKYDETSHFVVHIFDKSTLEIQYPFHQSQDEQKNLDQISEEDSVEILDEPPPCNKARPKSPMSCPQPHKKLRSEDIGRGSKLKNFPKHVQVDEDTDGSTKCIKVEQEEQLTSKVNEALDRAKNFRSKNPSFTIVMKSSYLYTYFLHVPSQFAKKHLKKEKSDILLQVLDGRTWPAKYCLGKINVGWKKLASDNNLKVGDVCVFELTNSQALTLKVLILPLEEEPHSPPPKELVQGDEEIQDVESKPAITNKGGKATQRTSLRTTSNSFTNEALKEADKFTSENAFFSVNIRPNQLGDGRPHVPISFVRKYLHEEDQIVMLQFGKKLWHVKLLSSSSQFSRGWILFAEENKLKAGDVCVFELINREDVVLDVHIFRRH